MASIDPSAAVPDNTKGDTARSAPVPSPAEAESVGSGWEPIDSAPQDATRFLAFWPDRFGSDHCVVTTWFEFGEWHSPFEYAVLGDEDAPTYWRPALPSPHSQGRA